MKITFVSVPKAFDGRFGRIQRNAVESWKRLPVDKEIVLIGRDAGTAQMCASRGFTHLPEVGCSPDGAPLLPSVIAHARSAAPSDAICYVNADIILLSDFCTAAAATLASFTDFLMIGQRRNLDFDAEIDFSDTRWENTLKALAEKNGKLFTPYGIDYFLFPPRLFSGPMPDFRLGRFVWDNWLVNRALSARAAVVDATEVATAIHQNHDYSHLPGGESAVRNGKDTLYNRALIAGHPYIGYASVKSGGFRLSAEGMRKVQPVISVVIPFHEDNQLTRERITRALCQTYTPAEEIILVDRSGTGTGKNIAAYFQTSLLRYVQTEKCGMELMREIVDAVRGRLICFLDEEYALMPSAIKRGLQMFAAHPDLDAVYGDEIVERRGDYLVRRRHKDWSGGKALVGCRGMDEGGLPLSGFIFRKDTFGAHAFSPFPAACRCAHTGIPAIERLVDQPGGMVQDTPACGVPGHAQKILLITNEVIDRPEWTAAYCIAMSRELARKGAQMHILIPVEDAGTRDVIQRSVFAYKNPFSCVSLWHLCLAGDPDRRDPCGNVSRDTGVFRDFLRRERFDAAHVVGIPSAFSRSLAGWLREYVPRQVGFVIDNAAVLPPIVRKRRLEVLHLLNRVACVTDNVERELSDEGIPREKILRMPISVLPCRLKRAKREDAEIRFAYAGEISPLAGIPDLLVEFGKLKSDRMRLHLFGVGDARYCAEIIQNALKHEPRVEYKGNFSRFAQVLTAADALVVPSFHGFSQLIMTALGARIPVVAPETVWLKALGVGHCVMFDPGRSGSLARAMRRAATMRDCSVRSTVARDAQGWMRVYRGER